MIMDKFKTFSNTDKLMVIAAIAIIFALVGFVVGFKYGTETAHTFYKDQLQEIEDKYSRWYNFSGKETIKTLDVTMGGQILKYTEELVIE